MTSPLHRRFAPDASAPQAARRALEALDASMDEAARTTSRLLVSELVTNSVKHGPNGGSRIELRATVADGRLRVEVIDEGEGVEATASGPREDSEWHWGLHLVDSLADRWGTERDPQAIVWFELDGRS